MLLLLQLLLLATWQQLLPSPELQPYTFAAAAAASAAAGANADAA
jgi:hypothetical protein